MDGIERKTAYNSTFAIGEVSCSADSLAVAAYSGQSEPLIPEQSEPLGFRKNCQYSGAN
jgi:hypothetical protein